MNPTTYWLERAMHYRDLGLRKRAIGCLLVSRECARAAHDQQRIDALNMALSLV